MIGDSVLKHGEFAKAPVHCQCRAPRHSAIEANNMAIGLRLMKIDLLACQVPESTLDTDLCNYGMVSSGDATILRMAEET